MPSRLKVVLGVVGTVVVLLVALVFFFGYLITKSFPETSGTIAVTGIDADVSIARDEYGVPHITGRSERDVYFAVGYLHAQDRLWQMELMRRAGEGRLAEILGEPALKIDRMFRTLGLARHARILRTSMNETTRVALQAYANGINAFLLTHKGKLPIEFDLLDYEPEPWTVEHSLLISRLMALELNYSRWVDVILTSLVDRLGSAKASEIFPAWPEAAPLVVPDPLHGKKPGFVAGDLLDADQAFKNLLGTSGLESGSNAWAIAGSKSATGKPILANDPHLLFTTPGRWYEVHTTAPGLDVIGASIPGVPFVIIGRNRSIAWGVTNAMLDDEDFYVEEVDSVQHPTRYRFNNSWRPLSSDVDTILVKDGPPVLLTVYKTHRGPIVNRMEPSAQFARQLISMRWIGHEISHEAFAFHQINRAGTWKEFLDAMRNFAVPAQNFVYADTAGNIGYHMGGRIPIRKTKVPTLVFPGHTDEFDWKGFVPFEDMPQSFNPPEGFVASANNKIVSDSYPHYLSNLWEPEWRIERITEVLKSQPRFSVEEMERLQQDVLSPHARNTVPMILRAYEGRVDEPADIQATLSYFRNWNFEMKARDVSTTLFQAFSVFMVKNTLEDEMGPQLLSLYDTLATLPLHAVEKLMKKGSSAWFDDIQTPQLETMNDIIRRSLHDALKDLKSKLGGEIKEWRWGQVHQVEFPHVFSDHPVLRPLFTVGPFEAGGSHSTVNKGDFPFGRPFVNHVGPSIRQIFDLSSMRNDRAVMPPGQSGQVFQQHYDDQVVLWTNGGYRKRLFDRADIEKANYDLLILRPDK